MRYIIFLMAIGVVLSCKKHDVEPQHNSTLVVNAKDNINDTSKVVFDVILYYNQNDYNNNNLKNKAAEQTTDSSGNVTFTGIEDVVYYIKVIEIYPEIKYRDSPYITDKLPAKQTTSITVKVPY